MGVHGAARCVPPLGEQSVPTLGEQRKMENCTFSRHVSQKSMPWRHLTAVVSLSGFLSNTRTRNFLKRGWTSRRSYRLLQWMVHCVLAGTGTKTQISFQLRTH